MIALTCQTFVEQRCYCQTPCSVYHELHLAGQPTAAEVMLLLAERPRYKLPPAYCHAGS